MAKTIAGKIIAGIVSVFKENFQDFIQKLFRKIPEDLQDKIGVIIEVVNRTHEFANSPGGRELTDLIPENTDDDLREFFLNKLSNLIYLAGWIYRDEDTKNGQLHIMATTLTKELTGMSFGQASITTEVVYQALKNKK